MLTKADHDFIRDLRSRGCAVLVFSRAEVEKTGCNQWELEEALFDAADEIVERRSSDHDLELDAAELAAKHGEEHPVHSREDWEYDKHHADNDQPYWDWVYSQLHWS